ncbi:MAG: hypothetical protein GY847_07105 [Proteobacteria bacterium]|nr:hypothetical protein [Pseudomonadota bacterium]
MRYYVKLTILLATMPLPVQGQIQGAQEESPAAEVESNSEEDEIYLLKTQMEEIRAENQAQSAKIEMLKEENAEQEENIEESREDYEARLSELELEMMTGSGEDNKERLVNIYGFFDVTFMKQFAHEDSLIKGLAYNSSTFILPGINLYFSSQMTESLLALVELRFTFLPLGKETSFEFPGVSEYEREDTTVNDPSTNAASRLGGMLIERAHLTWQPYDFFGVICGYFFTPYGIWNIDHGSPTLIPIKEPYLQWEEIVPSTQLGIQLFGRATPSARMYFDYAFTVSNGRGPLDTVEDLDENKALGLRLKISYEGENIAAGLGSYGYYGDYTDKKKIVKTVLPEFKVSQETTEAFSELVGAIDLLVEIHGVRIQGEYVRRIRKYSERPERSQTTVAGGYQPDYITWATYALLAWELPLGKWLENKTLTPYIEADCGHNDDTVLNTKSITIIGGLNFKPSPFVTLKAEATRLKSIETHYLDSWYLGAQMAVSF